ncbi:hypothetical protein AAVH_33757 [Aphelenchoides avenae]|nr:hypothetical protein AAVH_33757 [Aphelenchus avenae]
MAHPLTIIVVVALCLLGNAYAATCPPAKTTKNTDVADCDCGTAAKCKTNEYCDSAGAGTCSALPFCPDDKTTQVTDATCTCKTQTCNKDQYCDIAGTGKCIPACPDKTTKITAECGCGKKTCAANQYCDTAGDSGNGQCDNTAPPVVPACPTDKTKQITDNTCTCK